MAAAAVPSGLGDAHAAGTGTLAVCACSAGRVDKGQSHWTLPSLHSNCASQSPRRVHHPGLTARQLRFCAETFLISDLLLLLGDSGGVVNSLDFSPASLKSLGCFYFRCVLSSQWKAVTVNF